MNDDFYSILGVAPTATVEEIKNRFRFLSHAYHPDKFASDSHRQTAEQEFKRINEAYQVLSDPEQRERFDACRSQASQPSQKPPPRRSQPESHSPPPPEPPRASASPRAAAATTRKRFGRGACFGWQFALVTALLCLVYFNPTGIPRPLFQTFAVLLYLLPLIPAVLRLRDIGTSGWWGLVGLVPFGVFVLNYYLLSAPSGYAQHHQADRTMKVVGRIYLGFLSLYLLAIIISLIVTIK